MIEVLRPGLLTLVQDTGRAGHRALGVPVGGALDLPALRTANLLVGNPPDAAALEVTLLGPRLHFAVDALVALAGAETEAAADGGPIPPLRPVWIRAGESLELGAARAGCRTYLALAGGVEVPVVLGSRATCLPGGFGGLQGGALHAGQVFSLGEPPPGARRLIARLAAAGRRHPSWSVAAPAPLPRGEGVEVRVLPGEHTPLLEEGSRADLLGGAVFRVGRDSNRMGCRLEGPPLALDAPAELTSEGTAVGTVQLPPGGAPIVLLADGGTTGGYPRVAHVATADLPLLAQLRPGDSLRLREISLAEAHRLLRLREGEAARLAAALRLRFSAG